MRKLGTILHEIQLLMLFAMVLKDMIGTVKVEIIPLSRNLSHNLLQKKIFVIV
jgi:hypothetical protein